MQPRPPPFRSTWTVIRSFPFTPAPYVTTARSDGPDRRIRAGFTVICRGAPMTVLEQNTDQDGAEREPRLTLYSDARYARGYQPVRGYFRWVASRADGHRRRNFRGRNCEGKNSNCCCRR